VDIPGALGTLQRSLNPLGFRVGTYPGEAACRGAHLAVSINHRHPGNLVATVISHLCQDVLKPVRGTDLFPAKPVFKRGSILSSLQVSLIARNSGTGIAVGQGGLDQ